MRVARSALVLVRACTRALASLRAPAPRGGAADDVEEVILPELGNVGAGFADTAGGGGG